MSKADTAPLVTRLWESDAASALTNEAAREIDRLRSWLEYIDGNHRDARGCARDALSGARSPYQEQRP